MITRILVAALIIWNLVLTGYCMKLEDNQANIRKWDGWYHRANKEGFAGHGEALNNLYDALKAMQKWAVIQSARIYLIEQQGGRP